MPALNLYLQERSGQDVRKYYAAIFVAAAAGTGKTGKILGYYTLSNAGVSLGNIPQDLRRKLPRYPEVPAVRLGRLAIDRSMQGRGLGSQLIADAAIRCVQNASAWNIMIVDAKDAAAAAFYRKFGFTSLLDDERRLYIPRTSLEAFIQRRFAHSQ